MQDPHFNAKQQQFKRKSLREKFLCQNLAVGAFFEADKNCSQMFFSQVKSEKSLIVIQSNTTNDSIHPGVVATGSQSKCKCSIIQTEQNTTGQNTKIPKYKHDKIQKNKIQIAKIQM